MTKLLTMLAWKLWCTVQPLNFTRPERQPRLLDQVKFSNTTLIPLWIRAFWILRLSSLRPFYFSPANNNINQPQGLSIWKYTECEVYFSSSPWPVVMTAINNSVSKLGFLSATHTQGKWSTAIPVLHSSDQMLFHANVTSSSRGLNVSIKLTKVLNYSG